MAILEKNTKLHVYCTKINCVCLCENHPIFAPLHAPTLELNLTLNTFPSFLMKIASSSVINKSGKKHTAVTKNITVIV